MSYRDEDDPFEEDIVFDQAGLLSTSRKSSKSAIRRVSSGKCAMFSKTLGLCGAFLGLGLTFAIPGPLSPVPPPELSHDISLMTYEVMYRCQGFMIGAMFGARLLDRFNRLFLVFLALLVTALLVSIIPWCGHVWLLRTDMFLLGVSLGFLSTGGNVLCLDLWGRNSGPFMQALHFSFSLGIFLAPFLSQPLMAPINYALVAPSTTPATFPLHRLPRDVGNFSSTGATMIGAASPRNPAFQPFPDLPFNKSWTAANNPSPASTLPTKSGVHNDHHLSTAAFTPINSSSMTNATLSTTVAKIAQLVSTSAPPASNISLASLSPSVGEQSTTSSTLTNTSLPAPATILEAVGAPKVDVSTTTHRAPRPKPVMTNSEKLQDKKWENEKFRKPPPEDLVPVLTTVKTLFKLDNKTANMFTSSPTPLLSLKPTVMINSTKSTNVSDLAWILNGSNSSGSLLSSSGVPLNVTSSVTTSAPIIALPGSVLLKTNSSLQSNGSEGSGIIVSTAILPKNNASAQPSDTTVVSTSLILPQKTKPSIPPKTTASIQTNATAGNYTTPKPGGAAPGNVSDLNAVKQGEALAANHTVAGKYLKDTFNHSVVLNNIRNATAKPSSSAWSVGNEESVSPSSAELSLPLLSNPKSFNNSGDIGKSISLDEQDSAQNGPEASPTLSVKKPKVKLFETVSSPVPPHVQLSTPQPQKYSKGSDLDKTSMVNQKSFGGGHVKAMMEAKPAVVTTEPATTPHPNKNITKWPEKMPDDKVSSLDFPSLNQSSSVLAKSSVGILENSSQVDLPASPKHVHHSKPASTVVNDTTEVTHTVIDAFANRLEKYGLSRMELMYLTVGMVLLATSFLFLGFLCFNPRDPKSKTDDEDMNSHAVRGSHRSRMNSSGQGTALPSRCMRHTLIGLMMMLLMITSGVQAMYGQLLLVYAIKAPLQLSQSTGSALTATFWGALTSTRFACILLASALSPTAMLVLSVAICSCATWLLSAFASSSEVALWIGSVMVSVGTASVFPSGMLWMQRHILITHRVAAMLVMGPAMGEMFFPTLAYKMMVSLGPESLVHLPALLSLFAIAVWASVWRLARYPRQPLCSHVDESSGYQLANQHDEDDLLDLTMSPIVNGATAVMRNHGRSNASVHGVHRMNA